MPPTATPIVRKPKPKLTAVPSPQTTTLDLVAPVAPQPTLQPPQPTLQPATALSTTAPVSGQPSFSGSGRNTVVDPSWYPCQQGQIKGNLNSGIYHVPNSPFA